MWILILGKLQDEMYYILLVKKLNLINFFIFTMSFNSYITFII